MVRAKVDGQHFAHLAKRPAGRDSQPHSPAGHCNSPGMDRREFGRFKETQTSGSKSFLCLISPAQYTRRMNPDWEAISYMPVGSGRLEKRMQLAIPVEISTPRDPAGTERATTENVCSLGVRVLIEKARGLNERLMVRSVVGDLRTFARVVYCQRLPSGRYGVGLQFLGVAVDWSKDSMPGVAD